MDPEEAEEELPKAVRSEPLEDEEGDEYVIAQQNVGKDQIVGGGEFPDRDAPPASAAPGSDEERRREIVERRRHEDR